MNKPVDEGIITDAKKRYASGVPFPSHYIRVTAFY